MRYKTVVSTIGRGNKLSRCTDSKGDKLSKVKIIDSWRLPYQERVSRSEGEIGLRPRQLGALSTIRAHWVTSSNNKYCIRHDCTTYWIDL